MSNNNIVKIGVALKWRNTFDVTKKYYLENIVTACGCVFRCKVLQAQGKPPVRATDEFGHIVYTNEDVWDVLVDMAYYYNFAVDSKKVTNETLEYVKTLDNAYQKQQKEIQALQKENEDQWKRIDEIDKLNEKQQREIDSVLDTISCFSEGIWFDTLLWSNEPLWDNNKYAITEDLQHQINDLSDRHEQDILDFTSRMDLHEKEQEKINNYLSEQTYDLNNALSCFGSGVWDNYLHWSDIALWDNNKFAITDELSGRIDKLKASHKSDISILNKHLEESDRTFNEAVTQNNQAHEVINQHLQDNDEQIKVLEALINEHDRQIINLLDALSCFGNGQWSNELKWSNNSPWENLNLMCDTFIDIYTKIEKHGLAIKHLNDKINSIKQSADNALIVINQTFNNFIKEHESFKEEHQTFREEHQTINERINNVAESQKKADILNIEQQRQIDALLYRISLVSNGLWDSALLWVNDSEWSNIKGVGEDEACNCPDDTQDRIDDNFESIQECRSNIDKNKKDIAQNTIQIDLNERKNTTEHRSIAYQLRAIGREQKKQDDFIAKMGEHFYCFADGLWGDLFVWDNDLLWANSPGVINEALTDIRDNVSILKQGLFAANEDIMTNLQLIQTNHQLIEHNIESIKINQEAISECQSNLRKNTDILRQEAISEHRNTESQFRTIAKEQIVQNDNIAKLGEHFGCFIDGEWGDLFLWNNNHFWTNEPGVISEIQSEVKEHDDRLAALEIALIGLLKQFDTQKIVIEKQQEQLDALTDCFTVTNVGKWQNPLFWNNETWWSDSLITEQMSGGGDASVSVKSYDESTTTVSI